MEDVGPRRAENVSAGVAARDDGDEHERDGEAKRGARDPAAVGSGKVGVVLGAINAAGLRGLWAI